MIMPTLVRVRKNSSSSSIAIIGAGMLGIEDTWELCAGLAVSDVPKPRQWSEGEHVRLRAVAHRRVTVAARDLLAFDRAVHVGGCCRIPACARISRTGVRGFRIIIGRRRVRDG